MSVLSDCHVDAVHAVCPMRSVGVYPFAAKFMPRIVKDVPPDEAACMGSIAVTEGASKLTALCHVSCHRDPVPTETTTDAEGACPPGTLQDSELSDCQTVPWHAVPPTLTVGEKSKPPNAEPTIKT